MFAARSIVSFSRHTSTINDASLAKILLGARSFHFAPFEHANNSAWTQQIQKSEFHTNTWVLFQVEKQQKSEKVLSSLVESNQEPSQVSTHVTGARKGIVYNSFSMS